MALETFIWGVPTVVWALILSLVAILLTLLKDFIIPAIFKPKISLLVNNDDCIENIQKGPSFVGGKVFFGASPSRWLRLRITNAEGFWRRPARNCYVKLFWVYDDKGNRIIPFSPVLLKWSGFDEVKANLAPGDYHYVDLVHELQFRKLQIQRPVPAEFSEKLVPGEYTFKIGVFGDNFKPLYRRNIKVKFTDKFGQLKFII